MNELLAIYTLIEDAIGCPGEIDLPPNASHLIYETSSPGGTKDGRLTLTIFRLPFFVRSMCVCYAICIAYASWQILPQGMIAMAEQVIGGPEPDVVTLHQNDILLAPGGGAVATLSETLPKPKTQFVIPAETERYAAKANRVVIRHSLGKVVAVVELVSPGNKDSRHALRSFVEKTVDLLYDDINLLIIDPFPPGPRDPEGIHKAIWDEITDEPFQLPNDRKLTLAAYQVAPIKTAYVEPFSVGKPIPDMPLFLHNDFYINVPLEATYTDTWNVLPQLLRDLVL